MLQEHTADLWSASCPPRLPGPFLQLLSRQLVPGVYWCMGLFLLRCKTWHFPLLNFMRFLSAQFSSLFRSLLMATHASLGIIGDPVEKCKGIIV